MYIILHGKRMKHTNRLHSKRVTFTNVDVLNIMLSETSMLQQFSTNFEWMKQTEIKISEFIGRSLRYSFSNLTSQIKTSESAKIEN